MFLTEFMNGYIRAMLEYEVDIDGNSLSQNYSYNDLTNNSINKMHNDCNSFLINGGNYLINQLINSGCNYSFYEGGYDFWKFRNYSYDYFEDFLNDIHIEYYNTAHIYGPLNVFVNDYNQITTN